ncbi:MAG: ubiquinol-cytochrome c reductase iron-sulfur subunit [Actinomycetota bacterium]
MRTERVVSVAFGFSMVASVALVVVYLTGGQVQLEGLLLGVALGGLGVGISVWAVLLMTGEEITEERPSLGDDEMVEAAEDAAAAGEVTRRKALVRLLAGAGGALGGALAIPALSLGPTPGDTLFETSWTPGARLVDAAGKPIRPGDLVPQSVTTVFPEGHVGSADAQTLLIRLDADPEALPGREDWAPANCIGYSKICTHAGCPVGLYRAEDHELLCPCHQSTFDVLRGAVPTFGPADRALPQLPLAIDSDGYLVAQADFPEPVGPGFWNIDRDRPT